jgi:regulator of sigma E protease
VITILAFIVILGVLIFVHELGHFATAKWAGIEVPRFSIGLGPKMIGFKRGETEYVISWLPLGGYVRMAGMEDMEALEGEHDSEPARRSGRDFESKSLPVRALVISAGVIMNMLFAWFLFTVIALAWGVREAPPPVVGDVVEERVPEGAAELLRIPMGARIVAVNGQEVADFSEVQRLMAMARDSVRLEFAELPPVTVAVPATDAARADLVTSLEPRLPAPATVGEVTAASPAEEAGLRQGDRILRVDGAPVGDWQELVAAIERRPGQPVELLVGRNGEELVLSVTPESRTIAAADEPVGRIGIGRMGGGIPRERLGPVAAVAHGGAETVRITRLILEYLGGLFTGRASPRDVGGPILIYQITDQVARVGLDAFLDFMALFSINLAILNLLPIPILDGGQLMFLAVEGIRGRRLSVEQRMRLSQVGLVLVVAIMVWAMANDVLRLFGL